MRLYGKEVASRLMLGTAQYPSPSVLAEAFRRSGAGIATVSVRREAGGERAGAAFWDLVRDLGVTLLPNTAGCHSVREAVTTAQMARELFDTPWIKLEVIGHADTLQPDPFGLVETARILTEEGFGCAGPPVGDAVVGVGHEDCVIRAASGVSRNAAPIGAGHRSSRAGRSPVRESRQRCAGTRRRFRTPVEWGRRPAAGRRRACRAGR